MNQLLQKVHHPSHACLCLYLASGFRRFLLLDLVNIKVCTFSPNIPYCIRSYGYFHILASALPRSVKSDIWQAHWLDIVSINLYAK